MEGLVLPDPVGNLEILGRIRFSQVGTWSGCEAAGHGFQLHVGQLVVVQSLVPSPFLGFRNACDRTCTQCELTVLSGFALGKFRVDVALADGVDRAQRVDDGPTEIIVDLQAVKLHGTVEQTLRIRFERSIARLTITQVGGDQLELLVGTGFGSLSQLEQLGGHVLHHFGTVGRSGVMPCGGADLRQSVTERGGLMFRGKRSQRGFDELLCRQFAVTSHIPECKPNHGTSQRIVETIQVLRSELEALLVEAQLRVCQIVVIHQNERRTCLAGSRFDNRQFAVNIKFELVGTHDLAGFRILIVEADSQTMRAQYRMLSRSGLAQRKLANRAILVFLNFGGDGVDAGLFKPLGAPRLEIAAGRQLEFSQQIGERSVGVRMLVQIVVDALEELLTTHIEHELLQHGSALGIGDAVEVDIRVVQIVDRRDDRVGGAQLILAQCPALLAGAERGPSVLPFRGFGSGKGGRELSERLVKPQVVPPLHGHVIAEPHVCKLVQHGDDAALGIRVGDLRFEHVLVADGDHANVLHSAGIVFRHVNLVVLGVRIRHAPSLRIEGKTLLGDVEQVVDILGERFGERLTAVHGHRHGASVFVGVFGMPFGVWACADGGEIGAHGRRGFEHPQLGGFGFVRAERAFFGNGFAVGHGCSGHVGGDDP